MGKDKDETEDGKRAGSGGAEPPQRDRKDAPEAPENDAPRFTDWASI